MAITYRTLPVPAFPEYTARIAAGAVTFGVEWRRLDEAVILAYYGPEARARFDGRLPAGFAPGPVEEDGLCLHVFGSADGLEYLRFDCFDEAAHYHLLAPSLPRNVVIEHDVARDGPLLVWALAAVRSRLPELLTEAGAHALAAAVESENPRANTRAGFGRNAGIPGPLDSALEEVARVCRAMMAEGKPVRAAPPSEAAPGSPH